MIYKIKSGSGDRTRVGGEQRVYHLIFCFTLILYALFLYSAASVYFVSNDGSQYLSTAIHIRQGDGILTSVVYYDVQNSFGMPAIQTVWPPGLPFTVAAISKISSLETFSSLFFLNLFCHVITSTIIYMALIRLRYSLRLSTCIAVCYLFSSEAAKFIFASTSEPLFTLLITMSTTLLFRRNSPDFIGVASFFVTSLAVGLACTVRFQGIVFIPALIGVACIVYVREQSSARATLLLTTPALAVAAMLLARNFALTGGISGGTSAETGTSLHEFAAQLKDAILLVFGGSPHPISKSLGALFAVVLTTLLSYEVRKIIKSRSTWSNDAIVLGSYGSIALMANFVLIATMQLAGTGIILDGRYFFSCLPVWIISGAAFFASAAPHPGRHVGLRSTLGMVAVSLLIMLTAFDLVDLHAWLTVEHPPGKIARLLATPFEGKTLREKLASDGSKLHPIMSNQSQALYPVIWQPTLGVPERHLTPKIWSADDLLALARSFGVKDLIVFRSILQGAQDGSDDFIWQATRRPVTGLTEVYSDKDVVLYNVTSG